MGVELKWIVIDTPDPRGLAPFWRELLGWRVQSESAEEVAFQAPDGATNPLLFYSPDPKRVKNRVHVDLRPEPGSDLEAEVERALRLGATRADIGQGTVDHVVLADPEGNEFCIVPRT